VALPLVLAFLMGVTLGLLGGGGSILTVPLLVEVVGLEAKPAIATSLLVVGTTSAAALALHARAGNVRWRTGAVFGVAGMAGAYAGGLLGRHLPGSLLLLLFSAVMAATGSAMWRGPAHPPARVGEPHAAILLLLGFGVGGVAGLVGAGGGFLVVPALAMLGGLPMGAAVGTSLLAIALNSLAGFAGYASHVTIDLHLALALSAVAALGSLAGARTSAFVRPERLRRGFAVFVLALAAWMAWRQLRLLL
jgi:uncharacterized membrane protein YfcA